MKDLLKLFAGKRLFFFSLGVFGFFVLHILDWYLPDSGFASVFHGVFGFLGNLLMLPVLFLFYPGLLIVSAIHCICEKFRIKSWAFGSLIMLLLCNPYFVKEIINNYCM